MKKLEQLADKALELKKELKKLTGSKEKYKKYIKPESPKLEKKKVLPKKRYKKVVSFSEEIINSLGIGKYKKLKKRTLELEEKKRGEKQKNYIKNKKKQQARKEQGEQYKYKDYDYKYKKKEAESEEVKKRKKPSMFTKFTKFKWAKNIKDRKNPEYIKKIVGAADAISKIEHDWTLPKTIKYNRPMTALIKKIKTEREKIRQIRLKNQAYQKYAQEKNIPLKNPPINPKDWELEDDEKKAVEKKAKEHVKEKRKGWPDPPWISPKKKRVADPLMLKRIAIKRFDPFIKDLSVLKYMRGGWNNLLYDNLSEEEENMCTYFQYIFLSKEKKQFAMEYLLKNAKVEFFQANLLVYPTIDKIKSSMSLYYAIFFVMIHIDLDYKEEEMEEDVIYDLENMYNFNDFYCKEYYNNNKYLQNITKSYILDEEYNNTYINIYNFYIFSELKNFELIYNFEDIKFEHESIILPEFKYADHIHEAWVHVKTRSTKKKYKQMHMDWFDYIKLKNRVRVVTKYSLVRGKTNKAPFNMVERGMDENIKAYKIKNSIKNHLKAQKPNDFFFAYILYELALNCIEYLPKNYLLLNYFNAYFFEKMLVFLNPETKAKDYFKPHSLSSTYFNYDINKKTKNALKLKKKK